MGKSNFPLHKKEINALSQEKQCHGNRVLWPCRFEWFDIFQDIQVRNRCGECYRKISPTGAMPVELVA
ncbi:unnamed protein product [Malus baccata var. baccata]